MTKQSSQKTRYFVVVSLAVLLAGAVAAPPCLAETDSSSQIQEEVRIMSQVLEESLNQSSLGDWKDISAGSSPFCPVIACQYIPTVGAIFNLSLSFPVVQPATHEVEESTSTDREEKDLWKRFAEEGERGGRGLAIRSGDGEVRVLENVESKLREKQVKRAEAEIKRREAEKMVGGMAGTGHGGGGFGAFGGSAGGIGGGFGGLFVQPKPFDEAKVEELRRTLVQAFASYGSRMEHLADSERILIVVEAPKPMSDASDGAFPGAVRTIVKGKSDGPNIITRSFLSPSLGKDHFLLAFHKEDVRGEMSYESLAGKVEEIQY